jgi:CHAT domain-containing protein
VMEIRNSDADLRNYLLGLINTESKKRGIEERLMTDEAYYQNLVLEEDALVDDYLEDNLTPEERHSFEEHFLLSPDHQEKLRFAGSLNDFIAARHSETVPLGAASRSHSPRPSLFLALILNPRAGLTFAAIVLLAGTVFWFWFERRSGDTQEATLAFSRAYASRRPFEARISGLDYAPFNKTRGSADPDQIDVAERDKAELILLRQLDTKPSPDTLHALGLLYLSKDQLDKAQSYLERASAQRPDDPVVQNDIGVLHLQQFDSDPAGNPQALTKALSSFDRSIQLKSDFSPPYFNRALCLHLMNLPHEEREAWQKYLKVDPASRWAQEAKTRLEELGQNSSDEIGADELEARFIRYKANGDDEGALRTASRNRELIRQKYLPQRIAFSIVDSKPSEDTGALETLSYLASLEDARIGDRFAHDLHELYSGSSPTRLALLKQAQDRVRAGYELCLNDKFDAASDMFRQAREYFVRADDPVEAETVADYFAAYCLLNTGRIAEADKIFARVLQFAAHRRYRWFGLMTRSWWIGSQEYLGASSFTDARIGYESALRDAADMGDSYMEQKLLVSILLEDHRVGDENSALAHMFKLLEISNQADLSVRQKFRNLDKVIQISAQTSQGSFSKAVLNESLVLSDQMHDPAFAFGAALNAGIVHTHLNEADDASRWFDGAEQIAEGLPDESLRNADLSRLYLEQGRLEAQLRHPEGSLGYFDKALALSEALGTNALTFDIRRSRIDALAAIGDETALKVQIPKTLELAENYRSRITDERERNTFSDTEQSLYDAAIRDSLFQGDSTSAYNFAEMSTARSLLDRIKTDSRILGQGDNERLVLSGSAAPLSVDEIRHTIPANTQILQYRLLSDSLVIWIISKDRFSCISVPVSADALTAVIKGFLSLIKNTDPTFRSLKDEMSADLYQTLIAPVISSLDPAKELAIIPNRALFYLPFACLLAPDGERLIEKFRILYAPSATVYSLSTDRARTQQKMGADTALTIGNPSFDNKRFPGLAPISESEEEARAVANIYPKSKILTGTAVTKAGFLAAAAGNSNVIHFAGHYIVDPQSPLHSKLLLADAPGDQAYLTNAEITMQRFPSTRLVVLSGCQTAVESVMQGEGGVGLARTFIAAGVPLVVASQWPVDSAATTKLMTSFHTLRKAGLSSTEALRQAQISFLKKNDSSYNDPYYWAGFAAFGGTEPF